MFHDPSQRKARDGHEGNLAALERVLARCSLHADPTQLREFLQRSVASESTPATILHSPKGHLRLIMNRLIVDVNDSRFDPLGNGQPFSKITSKNTRRKSVHRVVCNSDRFLFVFDLNHRDHRTKSLFARKGCPGLYIRQYRRMVTESLGFATT